MKKSKGFSLIELIVAVAVIGIALGVGTRLFGVSLKSMGAGQTQQVAFEEARLVMDDLKTTLRFASMPTLDPKEPTNTSESFSYTAKHFDKHTDISNGNEIERIRMIKWLNGNKKQIEIKKTDDGKVTTVIFPKDEKNSGFKGDGSDFPVVYEKFLEVAGEEANLYTITLPVKFKFEKTEKIDTLKTRVHPRIEEQEDPIKDIREKYIEAATIFQKGKSNYGSLTPQEKAIYDVLITYGSWLSNDNILKYLFAEVYGNQWPTISLSYVKRRGDSKVTETFYIRSYCATPNIPENTFLFASASNQATGNWNTNFVYDHDNRKWYQYERWHSSSSNLNLQVLSITDFRWFNASTKSGYPAIPFPDWFRDTTIYDWANTPGGHWIPY